MADAFTEFLERPGVDTFLALRDDVLAQPGHDFAADDLAAIEALADEGDFPGVLGDLPGLMPSWLLSPRAHRLAGLAALRTGDDERAGFEGGFANACLAGILGSGDGTHERPYRVTHVADEYDVLEARAKTFAAHRTAAGAGRVLDILDCTDGSRLHFDVTGLAAPAA